MKKFGLLLIAIALSGAASANSIDSDIAERIKKVGTVCIEGGDCAEATSATTASTDSAGGGEATYKKTCATCHAIGVAGAPKLGDVSSWQPRIAKGIDALYGSALNGLPPSMPAKGMCFTCSDDDLKAAVDYMVEASQ